MKLSLAIIAMWLVMVFGQRTDCPKELAQTDDCADVINANACYNQFRFNGAQTLTCVGGKDAKDKQRKVCLCCSCVAAAMCNWAKTSKYC